MFPHNKLLFQPQLPTRGAFLFIIFLVIFTSLGETAPWNQMAEQRSSILKLDVKLDTKSKENFVYVGDGPTIKVRLVDKKNNQTFAGKDFKISITVKSQKGDTVEQREVTIKAGTDSVTFQLYPSKQPGVLEVQAQQPELLEGGTLFAVKSRAIPKTTPARRTIRSRRSKPPVENLITQESDLWRNAYGLPRNIKTSFGDARDTDLAAQALLDQKGSGETSETNPKLMKAAFETSGEDDFVLTFRKMPPERALMADGKDAADISVVLSQPAPENIVIYLAANGGKLQSTTLSVTKGQLLSDSPVQLTSDHAGTVRLHFIRSEPNVRLQAKNELEVQFAAPIDNVGFSATPPMIPLIDKAEIIVRLYDANHTPVNTDQERKVSFELNSPIGSLQDQSISIKPGNFEGRTSFIPTARGDVSITAFMTGFEKREVTLRVTTPLLLLFLSAIGGFLGGSIAYKVKPETLWRIPIGVITGFVLYWACLFGLISHIPRFAVLNQISAVVVPILGGWLGTEVFTIILKKTGAHP